MSTRGAELCVSQGHKDESDPEEWVNYYCSLADFLWKKKIKPNTIHICDKLVLARTDCAEAELVRYIQKQ